MDKALQKLMDEINRLPAKQQGPLVMALGDVIEVHKRKKKILELVLQSLQQLRVDMKYLLFDLDATRRERDEALMS
jgi:hypothetical protein